MGVWSSVKIMDKEETEDVRLALCQSGEHLCWCGYGCVEWSDRC